MREDRWLRALYDANFNRVYRLAANRLKSYTGSSEDAQDVVQEVFLLAAQKDIRNHPNPEGWLMVATVNICKNYMRAAMQRDQKLRRTAEDALQIEGRRSRGGEPAGDETGAVDSMLTLKSALSPEDYRIIVERYIFDRSLEQIALEMGLSHVALRVRIHRIRKRLKEIFGDM